MDFKKIVNSSLIFWMLVLSSISIIKADEINASKTYIFECDDSFEFVARVEGDAAWLFLTQSTVKLSRQVSVTGAKFSSEFIVLKINGDQTNLIINKNEIRGCKNNRSKAIWEHAKLNGADFRALGNEPSWNIELSKLKIIFVMAYGKNRYVFDKVKIEKVKGKRISRFHAMNSKHSIDVKLEGKTCSDTMSNESYEVVVSVIFDKKLYRGCGKALH